MAQPVKGTTDAGRRRAARARETRRRIIEAGLGLFLERGYVNTTVQDIAHAAQVAPATIYQAFGTKHAVLVGGLDMAVAGDDAPLAVLDQDWVEAARRQKNQRRKLRLVVDGVCTVAARTAPIKEVLRDAAATEAAVRELIREDHDRRLSTQEGLVDLLLENRRLRAGIDRRRAADTFFALVDSATYALLVSHRGWTLAQWQAWTADVIERELFGAV